MCNDMEATMSADDKRGSGSDTPRRPGQRQPDEAGRPDDVPPDAPPKPDKPRPKPKPDRGRTYGRS